MDGKIKIEICVSGSLFFTLPFVYLKGGRTAKRFPFFDKKKFLSILKYRLKMFFIIVRNLMKLHHRIHAHIKKHHKKYLLGTGLAGAWFFAVKALIFALWFLGILNHGWTFAAYDPSICNGVTDVPVTECEALIDFYNATDGDNWSDNSNWWNTWNICNRYRISCDAGHVIGLDIWANNVSWDIPSSIANLTQLQRLGVGNNHITSLPSTIGSLSHLTELEIQNNSISSLPASIGELSQLTSLSPTRNHLSSLPDEFANLHITAVDLGYNQFTTIPNIIFSMTWLTILWFQDNAITEIPAAISNLQQLTFLGARNNQLTSLPEALLSITTLQTVNLDGNAICDLSWSLLTLVNNLWWMWSQSCAPIFSCNTADIPSTECEALVNLYMSTNGANRNNTTNWLTTGNICGNWYGITCDAGHITQIDLSNNNLSWTIELTGWLDGLSLINLGNNWLDTITITNIPNLQSLFLNDDILKSVNLAGLIGLSYLNLSNNLLTTLSEDIMDMILLPDAFWLNIYSNQINYHNFSEALLNFIDNKHSVQLWNWRFYQDLCGNWTIEGAETCDDWVNNGTPWSCNTSCDGIIVTSMCSDISQTECDALINLYNTNNGNEWDNNTNRWNTWTVCDTRYGVSCTDNHVTTINLDDNNLSWSADFSALTGLVELHLWNKVGNNLTSIDVSWLINLTTLHVMHNHLASINLDGLTNLTDVNLWWNNLSTISLVWLTNLDALRLWSNQLSNVDLSDLSALTKLYLSDNQLSSIDISNSSNLDTLILYNNLLSKLPESTIGLTNLVNVNLNNSCRDTWSMSTDLVTFLDTKIGNSDRQTVINPSCSTPPEEPQTSTWICDQVTDISTWECLALIDFYNSTNGANRTTGTNRWTTWTVCRSGDTQEGRYGVQCDCNQLNIDCESATWWMVKRINLERNNLSWNIPGSLSGLWGLRRINLGWNNITWLPENINELTNLVGLSVYNNQISSLPASLYTMSRLTHLEINNNTITSISEDISNLTNLIWLHIGDNPIELLPLSVRTMPEVRSLRLSNLWITAIPDVLWNSTKLTDLELDNNAITVLGSWVGKVTQLNNFVLSYNNISTLPDEFFDLDKLTVAALDHNSIEWTMDNFCRTGEYKWVDMPNSRHLRYLDLSYNKFSWPIPECITQFGYLGDTLSYISGPEQHHYNWDNILAYNYLDIDDLSSELTDYLDLHFLDTKNHIEDRTRQYRLSDLSVSWSILSSREHPRLWDPITLAIQYANDGPVKIISGKVYVDVVSGLVITGNHTLDYTIWTLWSVYWETGDPCFDALYTWSTWAYRDLFETVIAWQMEWATIVQRLQNAFWYTGAQVDAGKFFVDTLMTRWREILWNLSFYEMIKSWALLDLADVPNCGTAGKPVYVFDVSNIDIDATWTILLSGFILPNFSGTTIENPISISSTYDLRIDTNTWNNEKDISKQLSTDKIVTLPSLPDLKYTHDAFEYRGYITPWNKSIINDASTWTLIWTSAIDFSNTSKLIIPIIITSPEEDIQALIASGTDVTFSGSACDATLLAPEEYPTSVASGVFGSGYTVKKVFKIWSSCTGSSMIFDHDVEIGVQLPTLKTWYVIKSSSDGSSRDEVPAWKNSVSPNGIVISFTTRHFSYFAIAEPVDGEVIVPPITIRYGWGITLRKDNCPNGDFSPSFYDSICWTKPTTTHSSADTCDGATEELVGAYDFAFAHNITTQPTCARAKLENTIRRKEMAKMISVFAINIMWMTPNTGKNCSFTDLSHETGEMNVFAKLVCQLGLMWYETDGVTQKDEFEPNVLVDRWQFGTILSRILRGTTYAWGKPYYVKHLAALKKANIMTKIDTPRVLELRWRVLLTMQRVFEMKK